MRFGRTEAWRLGVPSTGARPSGIGVRLSGADMRIDGTSEMKPSGTSGVKPTGMLGEVKTAGLEATGSESDATGELPRL